MFFRRQWLLLNHIPPFLLNWSQKIGQTPTCDRSWVLGVESFAERPASGCEEPPLPLAGSPQGSSGSLGRSNQVFAAVSQELCVLVT